MIRPDGGIDWTDFVIRPLHAASKFSPRVEARVKSSGEASRGLVITGATGTLGQAFARICEKRGFAYHLLARKQLDIADQESVTAAIDQYEPWAIINAAGYVRVDDAENDAEKCLRENAMGPDCLAKECAGRKIPLVTFSSDLVFNGLKNAHYIETDQPAPLNVYGRSKADAEARVLDRYPQALVIRTSAFFGPWDNFNFVHAVLNTLARGRPFIAAGDLTISPTYVPDLVNATLDLLVDGEQGIWHLANSGSVTWADFARIIAEKAGYDPNRVHSRPSHLLDFEARRPAFIAMSSERASLMPSFEESLDRYFEARHWHQQHGADARVQLW